MNGVGECFAFLAPFGDGWYRIFAWDRRNQQPPDAPLPIKEIRAATRRALGTDFGMHDPRWTGRFHSDERQVPRYRVGRVFLAGDAAHVHSPAGGQGMNVGLQDAANLGWKLAAAVGGRAAPGLLDSYQAERHPVGRQVLRSSGAIIKLAMVRTRPARLARNLMARTLLGFGPIGRRATGAISEVGGPLSRAARQPPAHRAAGPRPHAPRGRTGRALRVTPVGAVRAGVAGRYRPGPVAGSGHRPDPGRRDHAHHAGASRCLHRLGR